MKSYRQPLWAILVVLLWLGCGIGLVVSLGTEGSVAVERGMVVAFVFATLLMARAVHVLMDPDEKSLAGWALTVLLIVSALVGAGVLAR